MSYGPHLTILSLKWNEKDAANWLQLPLWHPVFQLWTDNQSHKSAETKLRSKKDHGQNHKMKKWNKPNWKPQIPVPLEGGGGVWRRGACPREVSEGPACDWLLHIPYWREWPQLMLNQMERQFPGSHSETGLHTCQEEGTEDRQQQCGSSHDVLGLWSLQLRVSQQEGSTSHLSHILLTNFNDLNFNDCNSSLASPPKQGE